MDAHSGPIPPYVLKISAVNEPLGFFVIRFFRVLMFNVYVSYRVSNVLKTVWVTLISKKDLSNLDHTPTADTSNFAPG